MKRLRILFAVLAIFTASLTQGAAKSAAQASKTITVLGTTDMHGNIWGYSYEDNKETTNNGIH